MPGIGTSTGQALKLDRSLSSGACPKAGRMSGSWALTAMSRAGSQVQVVLATG